MKRKTIPTLVRLYQEQRRIVSKTAEEKGISWAAVIRELIDNHLLREALVN
jgi:hypothetical protein